MANNDVGIYASQISGHLYTPVGSYDSLATITVPSGGLASITFAGIPAGYRHLQIRMSAQTNKATYGRDSFKMTFNGDTGSNYSYHEIVGDGAVAAYAGTSATSIFLDAVSTGVATNVFSANIIDVLDYSSVTKNKTIRQLGGVDHNGLIAGYGGEVALCSGLWMNSSTAVISITLAPWTGTLWNQYSTFALYGIK